MPRTMDLNRERQIRELRAQGLGVRQIAREIGAAPSTVSRLLRGTVDHDTLDNITIRLEQVEQNIYHAREAVKQLAQALPVGSPFRPHLLDLLARWPASDPTSMPKAILGPVRTKSSG